MKFVGIISLISLIAVSLASLSHTFAGGAWAYGSAVPTPKRLPSKPAASSIDRTLTYGEFDGTVLSLSDDEWKKRLSADEFYILRREGTERAYTGSLTDNKSEGTYHCRACGLALFTSQHKYDSQTGWPSFYQPLFKKNVSEKPETRPGDDRIEVECARCGSHLGHVFDDGPEPTGLRYCINSAALSFSSSR